MISALSGLSTVPFELRPSLGVPSPQAAATDFGSVLTGLASSAADTLRSGEQAAAAGIMGTMPVREVVEKVLETERTLQAVVAIRDKAVSAYLEITRMQI